MTIFWLAQIQSAIIKYKSHQLDATELPSWTDFQSVLLHTPSLMNTSLWIQYYNKENIFSKAARESWCPPDKKPLPGLSASNQDHPFVRANDPDRLLRYAFSVVQDTLRSGARRGQVIKEALELLQVTTIRLRGTHPTIPPYSETRAYFWIQIVHAAIQSFTENPGNSTSEASILDVSVSRLSSASFNVLFGLNSDSWKQYYSDEVWTSIGARMTFIPPDIRPLPSLIVPSSRSQERRALLYQTAEALIHRGN
ncbi:hypothetical protein N7490_004086 [Penicillium lividum]|nr:hypothetical protein N7490_004086 [Penicillium lividum]